MGKLLRNRQILDDTDFEVCENTQTDELLVKKLAKKTLKKSICRKFKNRQKHFVQKYSNFHKKIQNGSLSSIINETKFQCPICLELMVRPTLMSCGHMYCQRCLESNVAHSSNCCLCRQQQNPDDFIHSSLTENLINEILVPRSNEIIKYLCRTTDACQWIKRRKISNLKPGLIVDLQDNFKVWRRAIILKTYIGKNQKQMVNIKSFFKEVNSRRLAPLNFFTRSKYLEDFVPVFSQYEICEGQLERLEYRNTVDSQLQFSVFGAQQGSQIELQHNQAQAQQGSSDHALALFDWEMNVGQLLF